MVFDRELASRCALRVATGLGGGIGEGDSFRSKDFLIISCEANISSLCFACIASTTATTADITALVIDCLIERSMEL